MSIILSLLIAAQSSGASPENPLCCITPHTPYPIEVTTEGKDHSFGVQILVTDLNSEDAQVRSLRTRSGEKPLTLGPGRYRVYTENSRKGFPQEVKYQVMDAHTGTLIEEFGKTHVPLTNLLLEEGQKLRIVLIPAVCSYNAIFYRLGARRTPVAHVFARPYPIDEFGPDMYNGDKQFSSTQIAIAFLGMKGVEDQPDTARKIREMGEPGLRAGQRIYDPVLVLGVRAVAEDLARLFVRDRWKQGEDYRGSYHVTFLVQRTHQGRIPQPLLTMNEHTLATNFEKHLLSMMQHNVHRANEGGGYAGKAFEEVFKEAQEKVMQWPEVSLESTVLWQKCCTGGAGARDRTRAR